MIDAVSKLIVNVPAFWGTNVFGVFDPVSWDLPEIRHAKHLLIITKLLFRVNAQQDPDAARERDSNAWGQRYRTIEDILRSQSDEPGRVRHTR